MTAEECVARQREFFFTGATKDCTFRIRYLQKLKKAIGIHFKDIADAITSDLNKNEFDTFTTEIMMLIEEIDIMCRKLRSWSKPQRVFPGMISFPATGSIYADPFGVVLVMAPWNYPFQLAINPLIGALAAGNCVTLKPSNYSPATSALIKQICTEVFPEEYVAVIEGGREANTALFDQHFDYIFFTGSPAVGKLVMEKASRNLTPVSLELGGKSPCIVDETANIDLAAKRIVWGKFLNAGQTCIAPDYILVQTSVQEEFLNALKKYIHLFFYSENGDGTFSFDGKDFPHIINRKHFDRLSAFIDGSEKANGSIIFGGTLNAEKNQIEPTILLSTQSDSPVMGEEIFGPILPILCISNIQKAIDFIRERPKPLALYYFTSRTDRAHQLISSLSFGGGSINDTILHVASSALPFGGVGNSGMGMYHGKASFDTFCRKKSVLHQAAGIDFPVRYPPHSAFMLTLLKKFTGM